MIYPVASIVRASGGRIEVGFTACFGEPSISVLTLSSDGRLSAEMSIDLSSVDELIAALVAAAARARQDDPR